MAITNTQSNGVYINKASIIAARSISNEDIYKNGKPVDLGIEFELKELDRELSFNPKFTLSGNFNPEYPIDSPKWWSNATSVKIALQRHEFDEDQIDKLPTDSEGPFVPVDDDSGYSFYPTDSDESYFYKVLSELEADNRAVSHLTVQ